MKIYKLSFILILLLIFLPVLSFADDFSGDLPYNLLYSTSPFPRNEDDIRSSFEYDMRPGESLNDYLLIENKSENSEMNFIIFSADILSKNVDPKKETVIFKQKSDIQNEVGAWIKIINNDNEISLKPERKNIIPFKIEIPNDLKYGTYYGAIITINKNISEKNMGINVIPQIAVFVQVNVTESPVNNTAEMFKNEKWPLLKEFSLNYYSVGAVLLIMLLTIIIVFAAYKIIKSKGFLTGVDIDEIPFDK